MQCNIDWANGMYYLQARREHTLARVSRGVVRYSSQISRSGIDVTLLIPRNLCNEKQTWVVGIADGNTIAGVSATAENHHPFLQSILTVYRFDSRLESRKLQACNSRVHRWDPKRGRPQIGHELLSGVVRVVRCPSTNYDNFWWCVTMNVKGGEGTEVQL